MHVEAFEVMTRGIGEGRGAGGVPNIKGVPSSGLFYCCHSLEWLSHIPGKIQIWLHLSSAKRDEFTHKSEAKTSKTLDWLKDTPKLSKWNTQSDQKSYYALIIVLQLCECCGVKPVCGADGQ